MIDSNIVSEEIERRIEVALATLSLEEKVERINLRGWFEPPAKADVPKMRMADGPFGIRNGAAVYVQAEKHEECSATAFPVGTNMASTWNQDILHSVGEAIAKEAVNADIAGMWGPAFNMMRSPLCGRNFEYMGEDPFLAGLLAVAYIKGMQSAGCVACAKHFACNNQEAVRHYTNSEVPERTLREIYLPAFEAAVKQGGVWSVMNAYNKLNGTYCAENYRLQQEILKNEWGFRGFVISDWGAVESSKGTFIGGCDVEMPAKFMTSELILPMIKSGELPEKLLDEKVRRVLRALYSLEIDCRPAVQIHTQRRLAQLKLNETVALNAAREGLVLLKNEESTLPLDITRIKHLTVIGESAESPLWHGGGSSRVTPRQAVSPLQVLHERFLAHGSEAIVTYEVGVGVTRLPDNVPVETTALHSPSGENGMLGEYFASLDCSGSPFHTRIDAKPAVYWNDVGPVEGFDAKAQFSVRWTGTLRPPKSGMWRIGGWIGTLEKSGMRIWIDGKLLIEGECNDVSRELKQATHIQLDADRDYALRIEYYKKEGTPASWFELFWSECRGSQQTPEHQINAAVTAARHADAVLLFASIGEDYFEGEGKDRDSLCLPKNQDDLIQAVAAVNPNVTVVLFAGAPIVMRPWLDQVKAVLWAGYPGQEGGQAIIETLLGDNNPSGKIPFSLSRRREDWPDYGNFPGDLDETVRYTEGIFIGYRHFDRQKIEVEFPFGHGLSYTSFEYGNLKLVPDTERPACQVVFNVTNKGEIPGAEVAQVYVEDCSASVERPPRELKAFAKVHLLPGESRQISLALDPRAFAFFDEKSSAWKVEAGTFRIHVGASSRDLRLLGNCTLPASGA